MNKNIQNKNEKKESLKNWLIKKLISTESTKEEILNYITQSDIKNLNELEDNNEKSLINNIVNLKTKNVENIMVPRAEIVSIEKSQSYDEIMKIIETESHSRMPVYEQNLDNVLGFFHIKDLLKSISSKNFEMKKILREILYVAPKSPILDLLKRMRSSRIHIGLIVDEFGGVDGLVTIEDLVEEIVGEIEDEHDAEDFEDIPSKIDDNTIIVDASFKINELEKIFEIKLVLDFDQEVDTVGGLLFYIANKVPKKNEIFNFKNQLKFKVIAASERRVLSLEIKKII